MKARMIAEFRRTMKDEFREYFLVAGWLVLAGDGSRTATPRTRSNEARFAARKKSKRKAKKPTPHQKRLQNAKKRKQKRQTKASRQKKASTPQIWLTVLYHVGLGVPWDWRTGPGDSSEREHVLDLAKNLPEKMGHAPAAGRKSVGHVLRRPRQPYNVGERRRVTLATRCQCLLDVSLAFFGLKLVMIS